MCAQNPLHKKSQSLTHKTPKLEETQTPLNRWVARETKCVQTMDTMSTVKGTHD